MAEKAATTQFVSLRAVQAGNSSLKNATVVSGSYQLATPKSGHVTPLAIRKASKVTLQPKK